MIYTTASKNGFHNLNSVFENLDENLNRILGTDSACQYPSANVFENGEYFRIELAAPGFVKEDFKIRLNDNVLSVSNEKETEKEAEGTKTIRREFKPSRFKRTFRVPDKADGTAISAEYLNGILTLILPKFQKEQTEARDIEVK